MALSPRFVECERQRLLPEGRRYDFVNPYFKRAKKDRIPLSPNPKAVLLLWVITRLSSSGFNFLLKQKRRSNSIKT